MGEGGLFLPLRLEAAFQQQRRRLSKRMRDNKLSPWVVNFALQCGLGRLHCLSQSTMCTRGEKEKAKRKAGQGLFVTGPAQACLAKHDFKGQSLWAGLASPPMDLTASLHSWGNGAFLSPLPAKSTSQGKAGGGGERESVVDSVCLSQSVVSQR